MEANLDAYPLLRAYVAREFTSPPLLEIHPHDEMLQRSGRADERDDDRARVHYLRAGLASLRAIEQVVTWRFSGWGRVGKILDFASGYGRLTRLLLQKVPAESLTVAEINPEAVAFQRELFGVEALQSTTEPSAFQCDDRFELVFAGSLFSHLPEPTFRGWLRRLWALVASNGCLMFSLHNHRTLDRFVGELASSFTFVAEPFSRFVDPRQYGNSFVDQAYFQQIVREELGPVSFVRIEHGLANFQDLCLIVASGDFSGLRYDIGPDGAFDGAQVAPDGKLWLYGWAANRSADHAIQRVDLELGGSVAASTTTGLLRTDVAEFHGRNLIDSGWHCELTLPRGLASLHDVLQIRAVSTSGYDSLLWIGTVASAVVRAEWSVRRDRDAERIRELELQIDAMRRSRFWKIRSLWFRFKRALGLTRET